MGIAKWNSTLGKDRTAFRPWPKQFGPIAPAHIAPLNARIRELQQMIEDLRDDLNVE